VALVIVIGSVADLTSPHGTPLDVLWLLGGAAIGGLVGWAFVRRYRRNHPTAAP
jgi:hypothetical protein